MLTEEWLAAWPATTSPRARATEERITRDAQRLTVEKGFDGFTMDELAAASGVSRRTLFNHFASKTDAVLGNSPSIPPERLERFRDGLPHGHLVRDLGQLIAEMIADSSPSREEVQRLPHLLREPRLMEAVQQRFIETAERMTSLAALRGETLSHQQSRMLVLVFGAVAHEALERIAAGDSTDLSSILLDLLEETLRLMR